MQFIASLTQNNYTQLHSDIIFLYNVSYKQWTQSNIWNSKNRESGYSLSIRQQGFHQKQHCFFCVCVLWGFFFLVFFFSVK